MAFVKYKVADNAFSTLLVGISAGALSLQVQASAGGLFPPSNFIATIVQYTTLGDETSAVVKREKVLVSNNATDTFTITRGFDGDTPVAFNAGDFIYLHNVSAITEDIQDELTRLETAKLNLGSLRTGLASAWRLFFSNGSSAETALAFGASGTVLTSNGASSAPTFEVPTVDIVSLTEDTSGDMDADFFVKNNGTGLNKKIKINKYKASDGDIATGTATNKFVDPKQVTDLVLNTTISASANLQVSADTVRSTGATTMTKLKEIKIGFFPLGGTVRVSYDMKETGGITETAQSQVYKNGVAVGTNNQSTSTSYITYTDTSISVSPGDLIQLYAKMNVQHPGGGPDNSADVRNFRISYDVTKSPKNSTVITD